MIKDKNIVLLAFTFLVFPLIATLTSVITNDIKYVSSFFLFLVVGVFFVIISFVVWKKTTSINKDSSKVNMIVFNSGMSILKFGFIFSSLILAFVYEKYLSWEMGIVFIAILPLYSFLIEAGKKNAIN